MIVAFERHPYVWAHPCATRRQRCQFRRRPYFLSDWDEFARPALDSLSHLFQLADLEHSEKVKSTDSKKSDQKDKFEVKVDVQQFKPDELDVKMVGNTIVIEGKHEEKEDGQGYVSRQFVRRYQLPEDVKPELITCNLGNDGILCLSAPRMIEAKKEEEKTIPITLTGEQSEMVPVSTEGNQKKEISATTTDATDKSEKMEDEVVIDANPAV